MSAQNRSSAVMQQRRADGAERRAGRDVAPAALEYFPTPPWATRALCEFLEDLDGGPRSLQRSTCWEPACGEGHMARPLAEYFGHVRASDVHRFGDFHDLADFTLAPMVAGEIACVDWVMSNPPFKLALAFIKAAAASARHGFAMLVRGAFLESEDRHQQLWSVFPPTYVLHFAERVVMLEGRLVQTGTVDPFAEKAGTKASTATAYVWLVWRAGDFDTKARWIGPCRRRLERPGDYPDYALELAPSPAAEGLFA
jgi:hypothetical protein